MIPVLFHHQWERREPFHHRLLTEHHFLPPVISFTFCCIAIRETLSHTENLRFKWKVEKGGSCRPGQSVPRPRAAPSMLSPGAIWHLLCLLQYSLLLIEPLGFIFNSPLFFPCQVWEMWFAYSHHLLPPLTFCLDSSFQCYLPGRMLLPSSLPYYCFWHKHTPPLAILKSVIYCYYLQ